MTTYRTFGHGPLWQPLLHANDTAIAVHLGDAERDYGAADAFTVTWSQLAAVPVGWADMAIGVGSLSPNNNPMIGVRACKPVQPQMMQMGTPTADIPVREPIMKGETLWLIVATWQPPGFPAIQMKGAGPDPCRCMVAVQRIPGWRPMTAPADPIAWDAQSDPAPMQAVVTIP